MQKIFRNIQSMLHVKKSKTKLIVSVISILIVAFLALPLSAKNRNNNNDNNNNNQNGNENNVRVFTSFLTGGQESPENNSAAFGVAFMTFNESSRLLSYSISYTDDRLSSAENAAHFHGPAAPGENASVLFDLPPGNPKIGNVGPLSRRQQRQLKQGLLYINIHTDSFPDGEIRGQVLPVAKIRARATPTGTPTPDATPEETPEVTPEETPEVTPEETPGATPEITPEITPVVTP